ncbi:MAG: hypothetical protein CBB72_016250 [Muricauda sp. TMED12]|nr:MAG: hypothetical protein CBB72_016250 [Muricauda sp. TMED12]|tara:strand:- start:306 stop:563 length:258 start_codon:yes stop_codon:yes gene_type:complete
MADIFDFGFTAVNENELEAVQQAQQVAKTESSTKGELEDKLNNLYNAIIPLLTNLKMNPDKDYIYWPNRTEKVEQFEDMIRKIVD